MSSRQAAAEAAEAIAKAGGCVVGSYQEPLAGHPILLSVLPIELTMETEDPDHNRELTAPLISAGYFFERVD